MKAPQLGAGVRSLTGPFLEGYLSEVAVTAGETLDARLSVTGGSASAQLPVTVSVARLIHGDPAPEGPGHRREATAWATDRELVVGAQPLDAGSYAAVDGGIDPGGSFTLALWMQATSPSGGWQALAACWRADGTPAWGLFLGGGGVLAGYVALEGGGSSWCTGFLDVVAGAWCHVALVHDADAGRLEVHQLPRGADAPAAASRRLAPGRAANGDAFLLAAAPPAPGERVHRAHFNGRLARPTIVGSALDMEATSALARGEVPAARLLARWDLGAEPEGVRAVDVSGAERHGAVVNAPTRGVTGPAWAGQDGTLRRDRHESYDAIHFHEDDLDDARWEPALDVDVPVDARSGVYAVVVAGEQEELVLPFVVRPAAPRERIALLVPTLTWQAYSSNLAAFSFTEDGVLDALPCIYDLHRDGSAVFYATRRKPTRSTDSRSVPRDWGAHAVAADLYLVAWLERLGVGWEALGDEQLHTLGGAGLAPYDCLILGAHPEYFTRAMQDAVRGFVAGGGRVLYLGGNGLFWVTSIDPSRPHLMEVRKTLPREHSLGVESPGELQHSVDGEIGGLWERHGLPPRTLLGVDTTTAAFGRHDGEPAGFHRTAAAHDPRYAWVFAGVTEEPIGAYGANLGSAAGCETDAVLPWDWAPGQGPVQLARATHPAFELAAYPPVAGPAAADIALMLHSGGGAVFSAASITWGGSLGHHDYDNGVARISTNVLRRFLDVPRGSSVVDGDGV